MGQYRKSVLPGYNQALPKYQQTGQVDETADPWWEDVVEIIDPTGVSSYDDVYRTFKDPNAAWWEKGLSIAGALPLVGKFGKAAQLAGKGAKATTKLGKALQAGQKAIKTVSNYKPVKMVGKALTPVAGFDRAVSPASRFVAGATERALKNIPGRTGSFIRGVGDFGSTSNQISRFGKGYDAITNNRELRPQDVAQRNKYFIFDQYKKQVGGNIYDGMYNNSLNPTDMYFYAVGGAPNNPGFNALPDYVQRKIIANMMYGGSKLKTYQGDEDGSTVDDTMNYDPYENETSYYPDDIYDFTEDQMIPGAVFSTPNYGMVAPQIPAGTQPSPVAAAPSNAGSYSGVSIVDYLNQTGKGGSDFASRKQLAAQLGIKGYRGTADQNLKMLAMLQGKPVPTGSGKNASGSKGSGRKGPAPTQEEIDAYNQMQGAQNPYVAIDPQTGSAYAVGNTGPGMFPPSGGGAEGTGVADDDSGPSIWPYVGGAAGAGALGYGAYRMFRGRGAAGAAPRGTILPPPAGQKLLPSAEMANASRFRSNVNTGKDVLSKIKARGFYTVEDIKALKNAGYKNIEGMMREFPKGAASAAKEASAVASTAKKAANVTKTAEEAAKFAQNARKAIAPGQKVVGQSSGIMDAIRAGWNAARETPALKVGLRLLRRHQDGGDTYSAGVFYGNGGAYPYGGNIYGQMPQMGAPLPKYMYGMQDGGSAQEMYVSPEEMEMLRQQGYDFDIIG